MSIPEWHTDLTPGETKVGTGWNWDELGEDGEVSPFEHLIHGEEEKTAS